MRLANESYTHPIFDPILLRINTPPISALRDHLTRLIWTGATGAAVMGFTRAGKTTALQMIENTIRARSGNKIPLIRYSVHRRDKSHIRTLLKNICIYLKMSVRKSDDAEELVNNLTMYLAEKAHACGTNSIVIAVDEAQRLAIQQIDLFAELYDRLREEYRISLTMLFIGNKEQVGRLLKEITNGEHEHIAGRYFRNYYRFNGLRNKDEVAFCLSQYDKLRYPQGGPTYTEYFLPNDYARGFRMKNLADSIWGEFSDYKKQLKIEDWGMEYFIRAVNTLLTDYLYRFGANQYSDQMFRECIEVSGLVSGLIRLDLDS